MLINGPKIPQMSHNLPAQIVCQSPKVWDFYENRLHWASVVRHSHHQHYLLPFFKGWIRLKSNNGKRKCFILHQNNSIIKGQTKSKQFFQADLSSKKRTNEFDFITMKPQVDLFSIVFWRKLKTPKKRCEIN